MHGICGEVEDPDGGNEMYRFSGIITAREGV